MNSYKISDAEIQQNNVKSAHDTLNGSPQENKAVFDKLPELIAERFNGLTEYVLGRIYTKEDVDKIAGEKCNASQVYTKKEVYTKNETDQKISNAVFESKNSDMQKAVYDKNSDGVVDSAEKADLAENAVCFGGQQPSYYAKQTDMALAEENIAKIKNDLAFSLYTHTAGSLTGSGANGKFKATVSETISSIYVNGSYCYVKCGSETQMELIAGCWYTFILDSNSINFSGVTKEYVDSKTSMDLLWTNTNTSTNFQQQNIACDINKYKMCAIIFKTASNTQAITTTYHIVSDTNKSYSQYYSIDGNITVSRSVQITTTGIQFGEGLRGTQGDNGALIPHKIYGIK